MKKNWSFISVVIFVVLFLRIIRAEGNGFVERNGVQFMLNDIPFYGNGFNAYWLMVVSSDTSQRYKISNAFQQATRHSLSVARAWAFSDGGSLPLQSSPGVYNEQMFKGLDFVISEAGKYGMKLILSLVNNYKDYGGKQQYVDWAKNEGQPLSSEDDFFTNSVVKGYYKNHIKAVLMRNNTFSGVIYKDDPTIMAWELMNEPRCPSDLSGKTLQDWITEMASFLKSIDNKHLLEVGLEGFYAKKKREFDIYYKYGTDFIANNQIPSIDFVTVHSYPDVWKNGTSDDEQLLFLQNWLDVHIKDSQKILKKPLMLAEFGKSNRDPGFSVAKRDVLLKTAYSAIYSSAKGGGVAAGGLYWQLLTEDMNSFRDGYEIIFSESFSTADIINRQSKQMIKLRKRYARVKNMEEWKKRARENNNGKPPL